jgi:hypothetical protein
VRLIRTPWIDEFESLVGEAASDLVISSPFVSAAACDRLIGCVERAGRASSLKFTLVTNLSLENMLCGATNVAAILHVSNCLPRTEVRFIPTLHAKIYVADAKRAIVTSGNLTDGGLHRNLEYGVEIDDPDLVSEIRRDVEDYAALGPLVPATTLVNLAEAANRVIVEKSFAETTVANEVRVTLRELFRAADDAVLNARTSGKSLTAILEETIVYLLRRGPLPTSEIHARVQQIHPDLCDDTVDRVIDGRSYGKRWKHSVRTAQSHLKERGTIILHDGRWMMAESA